MKDYTVMRLLSYFLGYQNPLFKDAQLKTRLFIVPEKMTFGRSVVIIQGYYNNYFFHSNLYFIRTFWALDLN